MLLISNCDGPSCGDENFGNSFRSVQLGRLVNAPLHQSGWFSVTAFLIELGARVSNFW